MANRVHTARLFPSVVPGVVPVMFASNHHFPRHSHDEFGVGVVTAGAQRSWSGVGTVRASVGDVIMVNPGEIHDGAPLDDAGRQWHMVYLAPIFVSREMVGEVAGPLEIVRPVASDPTLAALITDLFQSLVTSTAGALDREERLLHSLVRLFQAHGLARLPSSRSSPPVRRARERLDTAPALPVTLADLATLCGISRFQLLRAFSRELGITPHAYLLQRRVRLARRLLAQGQPPAQAAVQAGFADQSHLTRSFVRFLGVTPGQYRAAVA